MPLSKKIEDKDFGEVKLSKYKKAKYLKVKVAANAAVSMSMPYSISYEDAMHFLEEKRDWVKDELEKLELNSGQLKFLKPKGVIDITEPLENFPGSIIPIDFSTKFRSLEIIRTELTKATYRITPSTIRVYVPEKKERPQQFSLFGFLDFAQQEEEKDDLKAIKEVVKEAIEKALKREAHNYLPRRLKELSDKHQLFYEGLSLRNTKTRWGSCTHDNKINLCIHMMKLPEHLIDYIMLHELAHTIEKNHSVHFWSLLSDLLARDAKSVDKELKDYSTELIIV